MKVQAKNGKVTQNMHGASKIIDAFGTYQQHRKLQKCLDHVRQLTRSRKWKHKEGRGSSHSYWSRTHGPRWTTHSTSGRRPWLWIPEGVPPPGRVPGQLLLAAPILKRRRRWYRGEFAKLT